jgi:hypothetical protein
VGHSGSTPGGGLFNYHRVEQATRQNRKTGVLLELVHHVDDVVPDHKQRRNAHQHKCDPQQRLNLVYLGDDGCLRSLLVAERVVQEDLVGNGR